MTWKKMSDELPTKDGQYLVVRHYNFYDSGKPMKHYYYSVVDWANCLKGHSYDFDDDDYEHSGFYAHHNEVGDYEITVDVDAWAEIDEYEQ